MFERCESPCSSNCCLSHLSEGVPISDFHKTAPKGHIYISISANSWNMPTTEGFLFLIFSSATSFNTAGYDQLMKWPSLGFGTVMVPLQLQGSPTAASVSLVGLSQYAVEATMTRGDLSVISVSFSQWYLCQNTNTGEGLLSCPVYLLPLNHCHILQTCLVKTSCRGGWWAATSLM